MTPLLAQTLFARLDDKPLRPELVQTLLVLLFLADGDPEEPFRCSIARIAEGMAPKRRVIRRAGNDPETGRFLAADGERRAFEPQQGSVRALKTKLAQLTELGFIGRKRGATLVDGDWVEDGPGTPYKWWFIADSTVKSPQASKGALDDIEHLVVDEQLNPLELATLARLRWHGKTLGPLTWNELRELAGGGSRHGLQRVLRDCAHLVSCQVVPNPDRESKAETVQLTFTIAEPRITKCSVLVVGDARAIVHGDKDLTEESRQAVEQVLLAAADRLAECSHDQLVAEVNAELEEDDAYLDEPFGVAVAPQIPRDALVDDARARADEQQLLATDPETGFLYDVEDDEDVPVSVIATNDLAAKGGAA